MEEVGTQLERVPINPKKFCPAQVERDTPEGPKARKTPVSATHSPPPGTGSSAVAAVRSATALPCAPTTKAGNEPLPASMDALPFLSATPVMLPPQKSATYKPFHEGSNESPVGL